MKRPHWRIRCQDCHRIRVHFRTNLCQRCWKTRQPMYRVVRLPDGQTRRISSAKVARQLGRAKGANTLHAIGKAYVWTSETARTAALKRWKQTPMNKRIGVRLGVSVVRQAAVNHVDLRCIHTDVGLLGVWYVKASRQNGPGYWLVKTLIGSRRISERAALIRLGYLRNPRGFVPRVVDPIGTVYAGRKKP